MWWYKVLWRGERRTVSTINEKDIKFQPEARHVLARWGDKWWEADVLAKDDDKKKLDRLEFSESGNLITSSRREGDRAAKEKAKIIQTQIRHKDKQLLEKIRDEKSKKNRDQEVIKEQASTDDQALDLPRENEGRNDSPNLKIPTRQPKTRKDKNEYDKRSEKKASAESMKRNMYSTSNAEEVKSHTHREKEKGRAAKSIINRQDNQKTSEERRKCELPRMDKGNEVENKKRNEEKTGKQRQDQELPSNPKEVCIHSESESDEIPCSSMFAQRMREKKKRSNDEVKTSDKDEEIVIFRQNHRGRYSKRTEIDSSTDFSENENENPRSKSKYSAKQDKNEKNDESECYKRKQPESISRQRKMRNRADDDDTAISNGGSGVSRPDVRCRDEDARMRRIESSKTIKVNDRGERNRKRKIDDSDEELQELISRIKKRKQRKMLQNLASDNDDDDDDDKVVEIRKNSGVFVNAHDFTDLKLTVTTPGTMATRLMRLALGDDLVGRNAKRGFKIPDNYFRAVYYACCKQFKHHAQDINAYRRTITDLCSKTKVKAKGGKKENNKDQEPPTIHDRRKYTDMKDENVDVTAGTSIHSSDGEKEGGRNSEERDTDEEIEKEVKGRGYSDSKSGSSPSIRYEETKSERMYNTVRVETSSHRRGGKDDSKMIIEENMTDADDYTVQRAGGKNKAEKQNDEERQWDGQRNLKVTKSAEVWAEQLKMGDKTAEGKSNKQITPHRAERRNEGSQRIYDPYPRSREKNYIEKGYAGGDTKYNNRERRDYEQYRYKKHDRTTRVARDKEYTYSRDRRLEERRAGRDGVRDDWRRSRDGHNETRGRSGANRDTKRREDSRDRVRGDGKTEEKHPRKRNNDEEVGQKMVGGNRPENCVLKQRRTV